MYDVYIELQYHGSWKYDVFDANDHSLIKGGFDDFYEAADFCNDRGFRVL